MMKLLTSKSCGHCAETKRRLKKQGISYKEVSVDTEKGAKLADKLGVMAVPAAIKKGKLCGVGIEEVCECGKK